MTTKSIEARREAFEAWIDGIQSTGERCGVSIGDHSVELMELAWSAALDSICVELPPATYGCMDADKVKETLVAAGVSYKSS